MSLVLGVPAAVLSLQQSGLLERAFYDGLYPNLAYRAEALPEEWPLNTGNEIFMTRPGLLTPVTSPNTPGVDPIPQAVPYEQWSAELNQFTGTIDTDTPTSVTANANLFLRNIHQLGLQAGQSLNQLARNAMFKAYLSGSTVARTAILSTDTTISVAALNGFRDVIVPGTTVRPAAVSASNPLPIRVGAGAGVVSASVVGVIADDPADLDGPGTLILSAAIGTAFVAVRAPVRSIYAPRIVRSAGGDSVDAISAADTFVLQQAINGCAFLRQANVQPHEDGFYHAHISPLSNAQVFADPVFQRLNQSLPEHVIYKEGFIGTLSGVMFFMNNESPGLLNSGTTTATASSGVYAKGIGAEVVNGAGVEIGRVILTGKGCMYEKWLNESAYVTEAGTTGKIGEFDVVNNGISVLTERIRLVLRAPQDRLQQKVSATWSYSGSFPIPSDATAPGGTQRFRRALVLEHSL
jgi:hypothetical protein